MKNRTQRNQRPPKINTLFSHHFHPNKNINFSPFNKNHQRCDQVSTSPSPRKLDLNSPLKNKFKKSPSKLFQAAHATVEGETFLIKTNSLALERFGSTQKAGRKVDKTQKNGRKISNRHLSISNEYNIIINGRSVSAELSLIINQFQNGIFGVLQNIAENSQQMLQLHSKINNMKQNEADLSLY